MAFSSYKPGALVVSCQGFGDTKFDPIDPSDPRIEEETKRWKHSCTGCRYLGTYGSIDFYHCSGLFYGGATLVQRFGDDPGEYNSLPLSVSYCDAVSLLGTELHDLAALRLTQSPRYGDLELFAVIQCEQTGVDVVISPVCKPRERVYVQDAFERVSNLYVGEPLTIETLVRISQHISWLVDYQRKIDR